MKKIGSSRPVVLLGVLGLAIFTPATIRAGTPQGEFDSMRFAITLWLPRAWSAPKDLYPVQAPCSE